MVHVHVIVAGLGYPSYIVRIAFSDVYIFNGTFIYIKHTFFILMGLVALIRSK